MTCEIRPGRADMTTTRVDRKTASGMLWVTNTMVVPRPPPDAHQLGVHPLAGHLVERPERLVHEQQLRIERQRPRDRHALLHPARQLPGVPLGERLELDQAEQVGGAPRPLVGREAHDLERQLDVLGDRPPVHEDRCLEDHPVVAVLAALGRAACR